MTDQGIEAAEEAIEREGLSKDKVLVVYVPFLHESLAGIVAGRIKERYFRPTYVLTDGEGCVKGSGRSIPSYSMAQKLHDVEDILLRYGGHPMAAGLSLPKEKVDEFRRRLNEKADLTEEELVPVVWIDAAMPIHYITRELILQLESLEPFGEANEKPLFAMKDVAPVGAAYFGKERQFIKFFFSGKGGEIIEGLYFRDVNGMVQRLEKRFGGAELEKLFRGQPSQVRLTFSYYPMIHTYMGRETLQVRIEDFR